MEELISLYQFIPSWHAHASGPKVPFGGDRRARIAISYITQATREDAVASVENRIQQACVEEGLTYDLDEWEITLLLVNGN